MLLNLIVRGKGNFTSLSLATLRPSEIPRQRSLTNHVTAEESTDPAHDQRVGDDHSHLVLHHAHHALHRARVAHRVWRSLPSPLGILQERARFVSRRQDVSPVVERTLRKDMVRASEADAVQQRALFPDSFLLELLGRRSH